VPLVGQKLLGSWSDPPSLASRQAGHMYPPTTNQARSAAGPPPCDSATGKRLLGWGPPARHRPDPCLPLRGVTPPRRARSNRILARHLEVPTHTHTRYRASNGHPTAFQLPAAIPGPSMWHTQQAARGQLICCHISAYVLSRAKRLDEDSAARFMAESSTFCGPSEAGNPASHIVHQVRILHTEDSIAVIR
jgi:hypothetical protein